MRLKIVDFAMEQLDKKYVWNKIGPLEFDSSGFTWYIYKKIANLDINEDGYGIDNTTKQMTNNIGHLRLYKENDNNKLAYLKDLKMGDLLFFHTQSLEDNNPLSSNKYPGHVGIYTGSNSFIHAHDKSSKVIISNFIDDNSWLKILVGSKDLFNQKED